MSSTAETIRVRYTCGAYVTNTVRGERCSSTSSAKTAAEGLATKLWPKQPVLVIELPEETTQRWGVLRVFSAAVATVAKDLPGRDDLGLFEGGRLTYFDDRWGN